MLGGLALLLLAEYASVPQVVDVDTEVPEAYPDLVRDRGDAPTAAIFEFPNSFFDNPAYLYYSTTHWQNLLNGYAGFYPPSYFRLAEAVVNFPDERSMMEIRRRGANYVVVHGERLRGNRYETLIAAIFFASQQSDTRRKHSARNSSRAIITRICSPRNQIRDCVVIRGWSYKRMHHRRRQLAGGDAGPAMAGHGGPRHGGPSKLGPYR